MMIKTHLKLCENQFHFFLNFNLFPSNRTFSIRMLSSTTTPGLTGKRSKSSLLLKSCRPAHLKSKSQFIIFILSDSLLVVEA